MQATGEAIYTQDVGRQAHHLSGVFIINMGKDALPYAGFKITIPASFKQKFPDVVRVFTAEDIAAVSSPKKDKQHPYPRNDMGRGQYGFPGDTIFAEGEVSSL